MKKIIFLLLVIGFMFSLSYAQTPINGVVPVPAGVDGVVGTGILPHPANANINLSWTEPAFELRHGSGSLGNIYGGYNTAGAGKNHINFAVRFDHEYLASIRAHDMEIWRIWTLATTRYRATNESVTARLYTGSTWTELGLEKGSVVRDTFQAMFGEISGTPQYTSPNPVRVGEAQDRWISWVIPDSLREIKSGGDMWIVMTYIFDNPTGADAASAAIQFGNTNDIGKENQIYRSIVPIGADGKLTKLQDFNQARNTAANYRRPAGLPPTITDVWEFFDTGARGTTAFAIEADLQFPKPKGATPSPSYRISSRYDRPIFMPMDHPDFKPLPTIPTYKNSARLNTPTPIVKGKLAGFKIYHLEEDTGDHGDTYCGNATCTICHNPPFRVCGLSDCTICHNPDHPCGDTDCPLCYPDGGGDGAPIGRRGRGLIAKLIKDIDVSATPADTVQGTPVFRFAHVNPENNTVHTYYFHTVIDVSTTSTPDYVESEPVIIEVNKGNPLFETPWLMDVTQKYPFPHRTWWRFDNSATLFYGGAGAKTDSLITTEPTGLSSLRPAWTNRTQPVQTAYTTPGFLRSPSVAASSLTGSSALAFAKSIVVDNWLVSPAIIYPTPASGEKVYVAFNVGSPSTVSATLPLSTLQILAGPSNEKSAFADTLGFIGDLTTAGWKGAFYEIPAKVASTLTGEEGRFHVALRHQTITAGVSLDLDDLFVGALPDVALQKNPPTAVAATPGANGVVTLTWTAPATHKITPEVPFGLHGYNIFRNEELIGYVSGSYDEVTKEWTVPTTFTDRLNFNGTYTYQVTSNFKLPVGTSIAAVSDPLTVTNLVNMVMLPLNLNAAYTKGTTANDIDLQWRYRDSDDSVVRHTQSGHPSWGSYWAPGFRGEGDEWGEFVIAHRYTVADIEALGIGGNYITDISAMPYPLNRAFPISTTAFVNESNYHKDYSLVLYIYEGGSASTTWEPDTTATGEYVAPVYSQVVDLRGVTIYSEQFFRLNSFHKIDPTKQLVVAVGHRAQIQPGNSIVGVPHVSVTETTAGNIRVGRSNINRDVDGEWGLLSSTQTTATQDYRIFMNVLTSREAEASNHPIHRMDPADVISPLPGSKVPSPKAQNLVAIPMNEAISSDLKVLPVQQNQSRTAPTFSVWGGKDEAGATLTALADKQPALKYLWANQEDGYYHLQVASQNGGGESEKVNLYYYVGLEEVPLTFTNPYIQNFDEAKFPPKGWSSYSVKPTVGSRLGWFRFGTVADGYAGIRPTSATVADTVMFVSPRFKMPTAEERYADVKRVEINFDMFRTGTAATTYWLMLSTTGTDLKDFTYFLTPGGFAMNLGSWSPQAFTQHRVFDDETDEWARVDLLDILPAGQEFHLAFLVRDGQANEGGLNVDNFKINLADATSDNDPDVPVYINELAGNYPNPFNPTTTIRFSVAKEAPVAIEIFNIKGQKVKTLVNERMTAGEHKVVWNGQDNFNKNVSTGIYFYRMKTDNYTETKKMIMLK